MSLRGIASARRRKASHSHPAALMRSHLTLTSSASAVRHRLLPEESYDDGGLRSPALAARSRLAEKLCAGQVASKPLSSSSVSSFMSRLRHGCSFLLRVVICTALRQTARANTNVWYDGGYGLLRREGTLDETAIAAVSVYRQCRECPICLDCFRAGQSVMHTPCSHTSHTGCLLAWLQAHPHCPSCRLPF